MGNPCVCAGRFGVAARWPWAHIASIFSATAPSTTAMA